MSTCNSSALPISSSVLEKDSASSTSIFLTMVSYSSVSSSVSMLGMKPHGCPLQLMLLSSMQWSGVSVFEEFATPVEVVSFSFTSRGVTNLTC